MAEAYRNIVYRLLPEKASTARWLDQTLEDQRILYNAALEERISCYQKTGNTLSYFTQCKSLTQCRKDGLEGPLMIQRGTLKRLDEAYKGFFRRVRKGQASGFPRFKGKHFRSSMSIAEGVKVRGDRLHIPGFGEMRIRRKDGNPYLDGKPTCATLKREGRKWFAIVCFKVEVHEQEDDGTALGLDMNVHQVTDSDGVIWRLPLSDRLEARKRRYQRKISRQRKGSHRRRKTMARLSRTTRRIARRRHNWQHHVSRSLADSAHAIVVENLNTKGMTASAKGTVEEPGRNVRAKAGLNRVIRDTGWSSLKQMLEYKAGKVIEVDPAFTSQTCHVCGTADSRSRRSQASFRCVACGHVDNADVNAAKNIMASGIGATARGGCRVAGPVIREYMYEAA